MPGCGEQFEPDEEAWDDDREDPQERDQDAADDNGTPTVPCSGCGRQIPDFADRCPHCGDWVIQGGSARPHKTWVVVVAAVLLIAFVLWSAL